MTSTPRVSRRLAVAAVAALIAGSGVVATGTGAAGAAEPPGSSPQTFGGSGVGTIIPGLPVGW